MIVSKSIKNCLLLALVFFACKGCTVSKKRYYSYKIKTYSIDSEKRLVSVANLISYGDYLFEFIMQVNISDSISGDSGDVKREIIYRNKGGVYLLKSNSNSYFEYDSFAINSKLIKQGKISEKASGMKFSGYDTSLSSNPALYKTSPIDTLINNVKCYYVDINLAAINIDSSYKQRIFLYKDKFFNSFYKFWNASYIDANYCIIGIYVFDEKQRQGIVEEPDSLRVLTKREQKICEAIIKKASF